MANQDEEEGVFETDEEKEDPKVFIPKLFCQVGDKKSGWHSKTVQAFAALLLTILSGGQGGKFSMADKGKPPPPWFVGSWQTYTNPTFASLEANTDLILGIFQFHNLDPRVHNLQPLYDHAEEGELPEEADGGEPGGQELGELNEENLEDIPLVFEVPVNTDEDVLAMTQNDDNTNQEREEPDSLNLVLKSDTETAFLDQLHLRLWTIAGLSFFCSRRIWCRKSSVFCLPFWVVGSWIHSLFRSFSQFLQPDPYHKCLPQNLPSNVVLPKYWTLPEF